MSIKLSNNFSQSELGVIDCEQRIIDNATYLCMTLLEPIRQHYNSSVNIHDGYRDNNHNIRVGGKPNSYHLYIGGCAAADFGVIGHTYKDIFDWVRLQSNLPFDKIILEKDLNGVDATIHIQVNRNNPPRRQAFIGGTGDSHQYVSVEVK